jgi:hypothetical protein
MKDYEKLLNLILDKSSKGEQLLKELLEQMYYEDRAVLERFLISASEGSYFQLSESYFVNFPISLLEDNEYRGSIEIAFNNFDDVEHEGSIDINKFYKTLSIFTFWVSKENLISACPWEMVGKYKRIIELLRS